MTKALLTYTALMVLEGMLAWVIGGQTFLLVASLCLLGGYAAICQRSRWMAEACRFVGIAALGVMGPMYYQKQLLPVFLCLTALPHWLAATQVVWEARWARGTAHELPPHRGVVYTIAFYASMALAFLLLRGMEPWVSRGQSLLLALGVIAVSIPVWDLSRGLRMKPGKLSAGAGSGAGGRIRRLLGVAAVLAVLLAVFSLILPPAAGLLCRISPRWQKVEVDFRNRPPHVEPPARGVEEPVDFPAPLPGGEQFPGTGEHRLPRRADLRGTGDLRAFVQVHDRQAAAALASAGPVYLRTHTLNRYSDGVWRAAVAVGRWVEDVDDGVADGAVSLVAPSGAGIAHDVFLPLTDGYVLPALPGLERLELPRVYVVAGDLYQASLSGRIRYGAVSVPKVWDSLAAPQGLAAAVPDDSRDVHLDDGSGRLSVELRELGTQAFGRSPRLADRIAALREWMRARFAYSLRIDNPDNLDPLTNFLHGEQQGYCDFFATAATLLLRNAGIPARMGYGYATEHYDPARGVFTFLQRNAHTWTEILVEGHGWVICDFTPPQGIGNAGPPETEPRLPEFDPSEFTIPQPDSVAEEPPVQTEIPSLFDRMMLLLGGGRFMDHAKVWIPALAAAIALSVLIASWFRRTPEQRAEEAARKRALADRQPAYYLELIRIGSAVGHPRGDGDTPREYVEALLAAGMPSDPLRPIIEYHYRVRYEDSPGDPQRERTFIDRLRELERTLNAPAPDGVRAAGARS